MTSNLLQLIAPPFPPCCPLGIIVSPTILKYLLAGSLQLGPIPLYYRDGGRGQWRGSGWVFGVSRSTKAAVAPSV